jgi:outer membrane protein assembly factor BamB
MEPAWRQALGGAVIGLPAVQAESVVVVLDGGGLKCYSREGRLLWEYYARGRLCPFVTRSREGTSYICGTDGTLIALNRSGRELWRRTLDAPLAAPVISGWDGRIFVTTALDLSCYTASGYRLWSRSLDHPPALPPVPDSAGGLALVLEGGELLIAGPFGKIRSHPLAEVPALITAADQGILVFRKNGAGELIGEEGRPPESLSPLPGVPLAAVSRGNRTALTLADGRVLLLSHTGGRVLWTGESHIDAPEETGMLYDERGIYVLSRSGASGFAEDGRRLWLLRLRGAAVPPSFSDDGILYSGGGDWILYAYRLEERNRPQRRTLYGPAPAGGYGMGNPPPYPWPDEALRFNETVLRAQLAAIAAAVSGGQVGEREGAFTACLMEIAAEGGGRLPLRERVEAARLLGYMGSRETIPYLAELFKQDPEPVIKAAAAEAIGRAGIDPGGLALRVFAGIIFRPDQDERVLVSVARACGALCRFSGPPLSGTGVRILSSLAAGDRPPVVRREARRELLSLRGEDTNSDGHNIRHYLE